MRRIMVLAFVCVSLLINGMELQAQRGTAAQQGALTVTLFSPLPAASPWGRTLNEIAAAWAQVTNNQVRLDVRHGRTESESTMMLHLNSNTIQAAIFTSMGLSTIDPSVMTVSTPFLIRTEEELTVVMNEIQRDLETRLNRGNLFIIAWSQSGFVNFFSREQIMVPDDLKRMRLASNEETAEINAVFSRAGFQVVEAEFAEIGRQLIQGQIGAIYYNPAAVAAFQLHTPTQGNLRHMFAMNIAPILGGVVINQHTWNAIGALNARYQQDIMRVTREIGARLDREMQNTVNEAIREMTRAGLSVNRPSPAQEQLWIDEIERALPSLIGSSLDMTLYNRIAGILARHRGR